MIGVICVRYMVCTNRVRNSPRRCCTGRASGPVSRRCAETCLTRSAGRRCSRTSPLHLSTVPVNLQPSGTALHTRAACAWFCAVINLASLLQCTAGIRNKRTYTEGLHLPIHTTCVEWNMAPVGCTHTPYLRSAVALLRPPSYSFVLKAGCVGCKLTWMG
jgi:hypothetical protein